MNPFDIGCRDGIEKTAASKNVQRALTATRRAMGKPLGKSDDLLHDTYREAFHKKKAIRKMVKEEVGDEAAGVGVNFGKLDHLKNVAAETKAKMRDAVGANAMRPGRGSFRLSKTD